MIVGIYKDTFRIKGREVLHTKNPTEMLSDLYGQDAYVGAMADGAYTILSIEKLIRQLPVSADLTLSINDFIVGHLTDFILDSCKSDSDVPLQSIYTAQFPNRVVAVDPFSENDLDVAYTSLRQPDLRNDQHYKIWLNDLVITSGSRDLSNSLVAVNGVFHRTIHHNGELFVAGGYANMVNCNQRQLAMLDTTKVGGHTIVPITEDMIVNTVDEPLSKGVHIKMPTGISLSQVSTCVVIHGRLAVFDGTYQVVGPNRLKINTNQIDLIHHILHHPLTMYSRAYRASGLIIPDAETPQDVNPIPIPYDDTNPLYTEHLDTDGLVSSTDVTSDEFIRNALTSRHSFIVLINTPKLYLRKYDLTTTSQIGQFELRSEDTPRGILRYNHTWTLPYTIRTSSSHQHTVSVNARRLSDDVYKEALDVVNIPTPWMDARIQNRRQRAELIDLYTA